MKIRYALLVLSACALSLTSGSSRANDAVERASRARDDILGLDFDAAHRELDAADPLDPNVALEMGRLALYELDCDGAVAHLANAIVAKSEQGQALADIARGCSRVTASIVSQKDDTNGVEIRFQDERDAPLFPLMVDTVVRARAALTRDLAVTWPRPTRIVVVRDLLSLAAMTGLPYESAKTTGTVAVAKWGRVTFLSPRASPHGFAWRDTIAHELTHLAVTRATRDRAPLWLQEGVAKREEIRWRDPGPFDDRPPPDSVVLRGMDLKLDLALDKLGPSIAMLPSADAAMVAFAEVTSFVRFYADTAGPDALPKLLGELRADKSPDDALRASSGADLHAWDGKWRAYLATKAREPLPPLFGLGGGGAEVDFHELRERMRLGELLFGRDHLHEAETEVDHIQSRAALDDASVRYFRARVLEALGRTDDAAALVADPKQIASTYAPWWAIRGRLARARGDDAMADPSFAEAVAVDPLDVEVACETVTVDGKPKDPAMVPLCDAARARHEPTLGRD
jgi:tetratricopeptide (TPR) repeat protein